MPRIDLPEELLAIHLDRAFPCGIEMLPNGCIVLARKPASSNPADNYLEILLAYASGKEWVKPIVWRRNLQEDGLFGGDYFDTFRHGCREYLGFRTALEVYDRTGVPTRMLELFDIRMGYVPPVEEAA